MDAPSRIGDWLACSVTLFGGSNSGNFAPSASCRKSTLVAGGIGDEPGVSQTNVSETPGSRKTRFKVSVVRDFRANTLRAVSREERSFVKLVISPHSYAARSLSSRASVSRATVYVFRGGPQLP